MKKTFALTLLSFLAVTAAHAADTFYVGHANIDIHSSMDPLKGDINYPAPGAKFDVGDASTVVFGWEHHFNERWSSEFIAGLPPEHKSYGDGVFKSIGHMATVKQYAPTAFVNYRFTELSQTFIPMVGLGINYTHFEDGKPTAAANAVAHGQVHIKNTDYWGLAYQVGLQVKLDQHWSLMAKVMMSDVNSKLTVTADTPLGKKTDTSRIYFNPVVSSLTLGYTF